MPSSAPWNWHRSLPVPRAADTGPRSWNLRYGRGEPHCSIYGLAAGQVVEQKHRQVQAHHLRGFSLAPALWAFIYSTIGTPAKTGGLRGIGCTWIYPILPRRCPILPSAREWICHGVSPILNPIWIFHLAGRRRGPAFLHALRVRWPWAT